MSSINPQNVVLAHHSRSYIIKFLIADSLLFSGNLTLAVQSPMVKKFFGKNGFRCKLNHNKVNKQINKKLSRVSEWVFESCVVQNECHKQEL